MDIYSQLFASLREDLGIHHTLKECINAPIALDGLYVARAALCESFYKKLQPLEADKKLSDRAYEGFIQANNKCRSWAPVDYDFIIRCRRKAEQELSILKDWTWQDYLRHSGLIPGTGSSLFSRGQNSFYEKLFVNRLVTTDPALHAELMRFYAATNRTLLAAEQQRQAITGEVVTVVNFSRLGVVRKNAMTDRTICTEPSLNMIFQRALGEGINTALRAFYGYDEALQPDRNREHARLGSLYGNLATIDLSSASDTISLALCEAILPSWIYAAILDCRSPNTLLDGKLVPLAMVSSMGNGHTFPLETYIFSLITRMTAAEHGVPFVRYDSCSNNGLAYGVFGDDIICPSVLFDSLNERLIQCGFIPNLEKSYNTGFFRESCGSDWYNGYNVRGIYIKRLDRVQDRFNAFNRLMRWGLIHKFQLYRTLSELLSDDWLRKAIPTSEPDVCGYKVPESYAPRTRYGYKYSAWVAVKPFSHVVYTELCYKRVRKGSKDKPILVHKKDQDGASTLLSSHNNFLGFVLSRLPQVNSIPKLFDHLFPEAKSDWSKLPRRDDDEVKCRREHRHTVVWDDSTCMRTSVITARNWADAFESLLIFKQSLR